MAFGRTAAGDGTADPGVSANLCANMDVNMESVWDQTDASAIQATRAKHAIKILTSVG